MTATTTWADAVKLAREVLADGPSASAAVQLALYIVAEQEEIERALAEATLVTEMSIESITELPPPPPAPRQTLPMLPVEPPPSNTTLLAGESSADLDDE